MSKKSLPSIVCALYLVLSACTSSPVPAQTTATPVPPTIPAPTFTPFVEPTLTSTPSSTPVPDPKAIINWEKLGLSNEFNALPPSDANIQEGANAFSLSAPDGSILQYPIAGSFVFTDSKVSPTQIIFGYTALLPSPADTALFDSYIQSGLNNYFVSLFGVPAESESLLEITNDFADSAGGTTIDIEDNGTLWKISMAAFRVGEIGSMVFVRNRSDLESPITVEHVARVYAGSIRTPIK